MLALLLTLFQLQGRIAGARLIPEHGHHGRHSHHVDPFEWTGAGYNPGLLLMQRVCSRCMLTSIPYEAGVHRVCWWSRDSAAWAPTFSGAACVGQRFATQRSSKRGCGTAGFGLAAASWAALAAVFIAELCGAYKPRHTYLRRFPLVLILAAELARFR